VENMKKFGDGPEGEWEGFKGRTSGQKLYFDYTITA